MQYEGVSVVCCDKVTALETTMMVAYIHDQRHFNTRQEVSEDTDVVFFSFFLFFFLSKSCSHTSWILSADSWGVQRPSSVAGKTLWERSWGGLSGTAGFGWRGQSPDAAEESAVTVSGEWPSRDGRDDSVVLGTSS